jgi:hypothetical protein
MPRAYCFIPCVSASASTLSDYDAVFGSHESYNYATVPTAVSPFPSNHVVQGPPVNTGLHAIHGPPMHPMVHNMLQQPMYQPFHRHRMLTGTHYSISKHQQSDINANRDCISNDTTIVHCDYNTGCIFNRVGTQPHGGMLPAAIRQISSLSFSTLRRRLTFPNLYYLSQR